jgi:hypothetical protein
LRIRRPIALQAAVLLVVALLALLAATRFSLTTVSVLCLATAIASGLAKLAVDASIQERLPEQVRASAFAHSETLLMLAWVAGGAVGLIPLHGRLGIEFAAVFAILAAVRAWAVALRVRGERLRGAAGGAPPAAPGSVPPRPAPIRFPPPRKTKRPKGYAQSRPDVDDSLAPPGFHIYRPTATEPADEKPRGER